MANYKFQHYVQRAYLEQWAENGKIKIVNRKTNKSFINDVTKAFGSNDFYSIRHNEPLLISDENVDKVFEFLQDYEVYHYDKKLETSDDFRTSIPWFDNWNIMKDGACVENNYIKQILFENRLVDIEIGWHKVEGKFCTIKSELEKLYYDKEYELSGETISDLYDYIVSSSFRTPDALNRCKKFMDYYWSKDGEIVFSEKVDTSLKEEFSSYLFKKTILDYQNGMHNNIMGHQLQEISTKQLVLIFARGSKKFITSDNPVFTIISKESEPQYTYFPLTPDILVGIFYLDKKVDFAFIDCPDSEIDLINRQVINSCYEYYVKLNE